MPGGAGKSSYSVSTIKDDLSYYHKHMKGKNTYAFIDASNLFYGGEKSLGWKIDYKKLFVYLQRKYGVKQALYFGGVEMHNYKYDYLSEDTVPLGQLEKYLRGLIRRGADQLSDARLLMVERHLQRVRFYRRLESFGYKLHLKPVKIYWDNDTPRKKANVDVDMTYMMMREMSKFDRAVILSGDGDFLPVLRYMREQGKEVFVLSRSQRTAKEIKRFAGGEFRDFVRLRRELEFKPRK